MICVWCDEKVIDPVKIGVENWHLNCLHEKHKLDDIWRERQEYNDHESDLRDEEDDKKTF
jgi:hypothetical protein